MAKILKKGIPPSEKKYHYQCKSCNSLIEYMQSDAIHTRNSMGWSKCHFNCPSCGEMHDWEQVKRKEVP